MFKVIMSRVLAEIERRTLKFWRSLRCLCRKKGLWAGFFPTALLALLALWGLRHTSEQLKLLREQIAYTRRPVLLVYSRAVRGFDYTKTRLYVGNVGIETVENVRVRVALFLVTEDTIYSYGQFYFPKAHYTDTTRNPKEDIWPRRTLASNEEMDIQGWVYGSIVVAYETLPPGEEEMRRELGIVADLFNGDYALFVECSYRRKSDFIQCADTSFMDYPFFGMPPPEDLRSRIGGEKVIDRLRAYLHDGPELSIDITEKSYLVYRIAFGTRPTTIRIIPRKTKID